MLGRLLDQLAGLGVADGARAHPAGGRRGARAAAPRRRSTRGRGPAGARRDGPARDRRARPRRRGPAGDRLRRHRHPARGARRPARRPARRHRHPRTGGDGRRGRSRSGRARGAAASSARGSPYHPVARARTRRSSACSRSPPPTARGSPTRPSGSPRCSTPARRRRGRRSSRSRTSARGMRRARRDGEPSQRGAPARRRPRRRRAVDLGDADAAADDAAPSSSGGSRVAREDVAVAAARRARARRTCTSALSGLRRLFWARPLSRRADRRAAAGADRRATTRTRSLLDSAVKAERRLLHHVLRQPVLEVHRALGGAPRADAEPGHDALDGARASLAAAAFATGERAGLVAGAVLLQVAFTLDCVDGQLARYTRTFTKLGAWLDSIFDRGKEYVVFAGLAIGASAHGRSGLAARRRRARRCRRCATRSTSPSPPSQHQLIATRQQPPIAQSGDRLRGRPPVDGDAERRRRGRRAPPPRRRLRGASARCGCAGRPLAGDALDQEDHRVPDRRALRGDLDHRGAVHARA